MKFLLTSIFSLFFFCSILPGSTPPPPKELHATRCTTVPVIDGKIDDEAWKQAREITDFIEFRPLIGDKEKHEERTVAYLMYNDQGIYFGGRCYEPNPDRISKELKGRDGFGTNDYIGIIFDTYNDKINGFEYFVTPLGEQWDAKMSPGNNSNNGGEDFNWNAVWTSGVQLNEHGWDFEMFIPFSAIRFGKDDIQDWGLNITRRRKITEEQYTWNPIDPTKNGFLTQEGFWKGVKEIKPPVRLQFSPYFSIYTNHFPSTSPDVKSWTSQVNGGLDIKYGISQAYTLDAILIPDFGQVQSDNQVLNLTPFEVKFNENRNFFSEGTELFNKGGFFYSRRIGGNPLHQYEVYDNLKQGETVLKNPTETKLINASKISGRSQSGLGIGFLNAITKPQYAFIENGSEGTTREELTSPLTNYNVLVLDQTLKNNSSVTLFNSSVLRAGGDYDSNVSAFLFDMNEKSNTWNINGKAAVSKYFSQEADKKVGKSGALGFGKISGRFNFRINNEYADSRYSHNDLGYFTNNNFINNSLNAGYRIIKPKGWYNRINFNFNAFVSHLASRIGTIDTKFQNTSLNFNVNTQTKKLMFFGIFTGYNTPRNDFYEPRTTGYFLYRGARVNVGAWMESREARKYSYYFEVFNANTINFYNTHAFEGYFQQKYRFSSKFSITHNMSYEPTNNNIGFTSQLANGEIIIGRRKINTTSNILGANYNFNNKMGINLRVRHYLSSVKHKEFYSLNNDGRLTSTKAFTDNADYRVNFLNVDMVYTWQFAPGSFLNLVWKDASFTSNDQSDTHYFKNLNGVLDSEANNNFSLKVIYFIDYQSLKKKSDKTN
ncbi:MAG: DUF5916 domain-containing protein [Saprospiraceae bacterium]